MPLTWLKRGLVLLAVLLAPNAPTTAALPKVGTPEGSASLAGQLLIASPEIGDPRFYHAVILMVRHNKDGAFGIMINRPTEERSVASLLDAIGEDSTGVEGKVRVFIGGPVQPWIGFVVHSAEYHRAETADIDGRVAVTSSPEVLRDIGQNKGPKQSLVAFGYSGWGAGQLENELASGGWFTSPEDPKVIFEEDREKVWEDAMARRTVPL